MEIQWPLILFTFFNCLAGGIFLMQGILTLSGKGKAMQLASCISAIVALAIVLLYEVAVNALIQFQWAL